MKNWWKARHRPAPSNRPRMYAGLDEKGERVVFVGCNHEDCEQDPKFPLLAIACAKSRRAHIYRAEREPGEFRRDFEWTGRPYASWFPYAVQGTLGGSQKIIGYPGMALESPVSIQEVRLDSGGYDRTGTYYGRGAPLWQVRTRVDDLYFRLRAPDRDAVKRRVLELYPYARFYR